MYVIVVDFHVHPGHAQAFEAAVKANASQSLASEAGCRQFDVCCDPADPALFMLYELYDDAAAFDEHLRTAHFRAFDAASAPWVSHKRVRRLLRIEPAPR